MFTRTALNGSVKVVKLILHIAYKVCVYYNICMCVVYMHCMLKNSIVAAQLT